MDLWVFYIGTMEDQPLLPAGLSGPIKPNGQLNGITRDFGKQFTTNLLNVENGQRATPLSLRSFTRRIELSLTMSMKVSYFWGSSASLTVLSYRRRWYLRLGYKMRFVWPRGLTLEQWENAHPIRQRMLRDLYYNTGQKEIVHHSGS